MPAVPQFVHDMANRSMASREFLYDSSFTYEDIRDKYDDNSDQVRVQLFTHKAQIGAGHHVGVRVLTLGENAHCLTFELFAEGLYEKPVLFCNSAPHSQDPVVYINFGAATAKPLEVFAWSVKWMKDAPQYDITRHEGCNCQDFAHELITWLEPERLKNGEEQLPAKETVQDVVKEVLKRTGSSDGSADSGASFAVGSVRSGSFGAMYRSVKEGHTPSSAEAMRCPITSTPSASPNASSLMSLTVMPSLVSAATRKSSSPSPASGPSSASILPLYFASIASASSYGCGGSSSPHISRGGGRSLGSSSSASTRCIRS